MKFIDYLQKMPESNNVGEEALADYKLLIEQLPHIHIFIVDSKILKEEHRYEWYCSCGLRK